MAGTKGQPQYPYIASQLALGKKKYQNTFCDAIQVKPYDRYLIPRFTHFTILVKPYDISDSYDYVMTQLISDQ